MEIPTAVIAVCLLALAQGCEQPPTVATVCENEGPLHMNCPSGMVLKMDMDNSYYGRTAPYSDVCDPAPRRVRTRAEDTACIASTSSVELAGCEGQQSCVVPATNARFTDPCFGTYKYLKVSFTCIEAAPVVPAAAIVCENEGPLQVGCPAGKIMMIDTNNSYYGRTALYNDVCDPAPRRIRTQGEDTNCMAASSADVLDKCQGQQTCTVSATNAVFTDPCVGTYKYLKVSFTCITGPWLGRSCISSSECTTVDSRAACTAGACVCRPGYFYSVSTFQCLPACSEASLQSSFQKFNNVRLNLDTSFGNKTHQVSGKILTPADCEAACVGTTGCVAYSLKTKNKKVVCVLHDVTATDQPCRFGDDLQKWTYFQRNCA